MDCPHCLFRNPAGFRFCGQCGALLEVRHTAVAKREDQAELRHLTVMFCDLVGSVALSITLDPEEYREVLCRYLDAASSVVRRFSGFVGQYLGDGMLVYFGYPKAREDSAILAVRCGLGIQRAIEGLNREFFTQLQVRIGLHTGLLVVGELGTGEGRETSAVVGKTPNLAARLQSLAQPGTVVISSDTWKLVRLHFDCESLGWQRPKGFTEPLLVYQVIGEADVNAARIAMRDGTRLYGRDAELERLRNRWTQAKVGAWPRVVLTGEAGIGKSRLLREFTGSLSGEAHFCVVVRGSAAAQSSAFEPLLQLLREWMKIGRADTPEERHEKIERFVALLKFPPETTALLEAVFCPDESPLPAAHALSPTAARQGFIGWLPMFLRALAERWPVVFAVEDLHWLDPSTLEALAHLFAGAPLTRILVVLTARPEFSAPWMPAERIALERLHTRQVEEFAEAVGGGKELPAEVLRQIVSKANGVPLFIEEMTKMVIETGLLVERETHFETRGALPPMAIPDTLHELLMARLDATGLRELAQIAAVLGQEFHYSMLRLLHPSDDGVLDEKLDRLVEAGLLSREGTPPDATFTFRHALIQTEAYQALLKRKRQDYHERIAEMLAASFPDMLRQQPELVARHYTEAGRHVEAIELWLQAAMRSEYRSANAEAITQAEQGLALLPALAGEEARRERELSLTIVRGRAAAMLHGYASEEVSRNYARARELCMENEGRPETYQVLAVLHAFYISRAEFSLAGEIANQMLRLGESTGMTIFLDNAWLSLGSNAFYLGQFGEAVRCFRRALEIYDSHTGELPTRTLDIKVAALAWGGLALLLSGQPDEGLASTREARDFALGTGHIHSIVFARHFLQLAHYWREEPAEVLVEAEGFAAVCREQGFVYWLTLGAMIEGWAHVRLGRAGALEMIAKGLAGWQRTGARLASSQHFGFLADAMARTGAIADGLAAIAQAEDMVRITGEHCYASHVADLKGRLLLRQSPPDAAGAEAAFRTAAALARELSAAWLELRAATHLAALLRDQSRRDEARSVLDPCLRAIAGGGETTLVREARELLAALQN